ncbi:hypothetical protein ACFRCG_33180 [Embleya sp. NPDC056575]|uniref:hypothetical protein n=1 Tax=unclassified Embleya TaxID=2699296 RepID=UPI00369462D5
MRVKLIVREVSRDDPDQYAEHEDGSRHFMGQPLRMHWDEIQQNGGHLDLVLTPGPLAAIGRSAKTSDPDLLLKSELVHPSVRCEVIGPETVRVSLRHWLHRDPDETFLSIGWSFEITEQEKAALRHIG